jgi:hypothetical protein
MGSADEYREYVEQCIVLASTCLNPGDKVRLRDRRSRRAVRADLVLVELLCGTSLVSPPRLLERLLAIA